jgi:(p)ppGpp synthase/HD superfamily hydrolase
MSLPPGTFELIQKAAGFCARAHRHQERADGTPYAAHPVRVALALRHLFAIDDSHALCAALLHDVIEEGGVTYDEIHSEFGKEIADLVAGMSKDLRLPEAAREAEFNERLGAGSWKLKAIKLADAYDNLSDRKSGALGKAEHAVALAEDEYRLRFAAGLLRDLIAAESLRRAVKGDREDE